MNKVIRSDLVRTLQKSLHFAKRVPGARLSKTLLSLTEVDLNILFKFFTDEISKSLIAGNTIELRNFGIFELRIRKEKTKARNPKTGEKCRVPSHSVVAFRAGKQLRKAVWNLNKDA